MTGLTFLKLGGSLITDKDTPSTAHPSVIQQIAQEVSASIKANPDMQLVLGHGSGSFGHMAAKEYGTRQGVADARGWRGYAEVWYQASSLNRIVVDIFHQAKLPVINFPASANAISDNGQPAQWDLKALQTSLAAGLLPVVYGDVVIDTSLGGTIWSTEDVFNHLAAQLHPQRILLAGIEPGVWADYPDCTRLIEKITPHNISEVMPSIQGSASTDVTGGMQAKVSEMLQLVQSLPGLEIAIFSGQSPGNIEAALNGQNTGTTISIE